MEASLFMFTYNYIRYMYMKEGICVCVCVKYNLWGLIMFPSKSQRLTQTLLPSMRNILLKLLLSDLKQLPK